VSSGQGSSPSLGRGQVRGFLCFLVLCYPMCQPPAHLHMPRPPTQGRAFTAPCVPVPSKPALL